MLLVSPMEGTAILFMNGYRYSQNNLDYYVNFKDLTVKEDQKTLSGELEITIKLLFFSVHARATLHHHEQSKSFMNKVSLKVIKSQSYLLKILH